MTNSEANPDLRAGIVTATAIALQLAQSTDPSLGNADVQAISAAWYQVLKALQESPTPDPAVPGSEDGWARRKPIIQGMVELIQAAEEELRSGNAGPEVIDKLKSDLQMSALRLHCCGKEAPSAIDFSDAPLDLSRAWAAREFASGQSFAAARSTGGR